MVYRVDYRNFSNPVVYVKTGEQKKIVSSYCEKVKTLQNKYEYATGGAVYSRQHAWLTVKSSKARLLSC